jgi:HK97 family phage portal protein
MWQRKRKTGGRGLPGVLQDGAVWKPTGVTNEQAQFLATRKFTAGEIAGQMFLLDPSDLGIPVEGTSLTYANLEQRNARRLQVALLPWIVRIEAAISALLFNPRYMKFNVNGFLRGDLKTRFESYAIGIQNQFLEPNEAREFEDWSPLPEPSPEEAPDAIPAF